MGTVESTIRPATVLGVLLSLSFWTVLFIAAGAFAAVSLAPKVLAWRSWDREYHRNHAQLVELERQAETMAKVVEALKSDPEFLAEMVRQELAVQRPGEEVIDVDSSLSLGSSVPSREPPAQVRPSDSWDPVLMALATDQQLRYSLLAAAAALVIVAFVWLQDPHESLTVAELPDASRR